MPSPTTLVVFAAAALVLLAVPGPAVFYVVARSATQGVRAGLVSVAGIHTGTLVHVLAAVAGLSALLASSATAFTVVKLAGAAYLVLLGARALLGASRQRRAPPVVAAAPRSTRRIFVDAVVVNVLNPKTALFFVAFVPQFVQPAGGAVPQLLVLGAVFVVLGLITDGMWAVAAAWAGRRLVCGGGSAARTGLVAGTAYIGLGVATAATGARP